MKITHEWLIEKIKNNKYVLITGLLGVILLLLPVGKKDAGNVYIPKAESDEFNIELAEARLEALLTKIDGAGNVEVLLSVGDCGERILATEGESESSVRQNEGESSRETRTNTQTVVITKNGENEVVTLGYIYPEYIGAVIVCEGGESSEVRLNITEAVKSATGLTTDKITVVKMTDK